MSKRKIRTNVVMSEAVGDCYRVKLMKAHGRQYRVVVCRTRPNVPQGHVHFLKENTGPIPQRSTAIGEFRRLVTECQEVVAAAAEVVQPVAKEVAPAVIQRVVHVDRLRALMEARRLR